MEIALLSSCVNTLLPKIWKHSKEKAKEKTEIKIDVEAIQATIRLLDAAYEGAKYAGDGPMVKQLKKQAREVSQEMYDSMQRFFMIKMTTKDRRKKLEGLRLDLEKHASKAPEKPEDPSVANPMYMGEAQQELLELVQLPDSKTSERGRKVVSIVGFGGLGKTLLARLVYEQDPSGTPPVDFTLRAWVTAAAKEPKEILREILNQLDTACKEERLRSAKMQADKSVTTANKESNDVFMKRVKHLETTCIYANAKLEKPQADTPENYGKPELAKLGECIAERLQEKRYFIVIDDMQSDEQWNSMNDAFPKNRNGDGTIVVTTTVQSVADACSSHDGFVYKLSPLDMAKSLDLFFRNRKWNLNRTKDNVSDLLKKCDGLPLAIVSMSESLKDHIVLTKTDCESACEGPLGADLVKEDCSLKRLTVNKYTGLTGYNLRACLLYFCMYKHNMGAVPKRNSLIRRWEAERFLVEENATRRPANVGVENLKTLVDRNIIQPMIPGRDGDARRCQPPGMMMEYIYRISTSENFAALVSEAMEMGDSRIRRLSFHADSPADEMKILKMKLSIVLTLAVSGNGCKAILDFEKYELIAVLDLKECENLSADHVKYICKLVLLKYLSLGDSIKEIPKDISGLQLLETLEMRRKETVKVYREVFELPNLKHLVGNFMLREESDGTLTKFLEEDSGLETVTGYVSKTNKQIPMLMCHMMRVRKLKIYCDAEVDTKDRQYLQTAVEKFIGRGMDTYRPDNSYSLSIELTNSTGKPWATPLEFLQRPGSLGSLKLRGNWGSAKLHTATTGGLTTITGIRKLCLSDTYKTGQEILDALTHMTALENLKLKETVLRAITIKAGIFQSLVRLFLVGETMKPGITIQHDALPIIVSLHLISKDPILKVEGYQVQLPMTHSEHNQVQLPNGCLPCLYEIALGPLADSEKVKAWKSVAKGHPNRPAILEMHEAQAL